MEKKKILDIGIGLGGLYVKRTPNIIRVGLDKRGNNLGQCMKMYPIDGIVGNATTERNGGLPFLDKSFSHVDILFPHQSLFSSLCYSPSFWQEIYRVLHDGGSIRTVFDTENDKRFISSKPIINPERLIIDLLSSSGFNVNLSEIEKTEIYKLGTFFSHKILKDMQKGKNIKVFNLIGYKQ